MAPDWHAERARLVKLCTRLTGDRDAAEDLAQEVLLRAHTRRATLRLPQRRRAWLAGIARHVCTDWVRRRIRQPATVAIENGAPLLSDFDLEAILDQNEWGMLLDRSLALLPAAVRAMLVDRYIHDLPLAEVAGRRGLTEGAAAMRLQRGRERFRRVFATRYPEEALAYGLVSPPDAGAWQETRIWCGACGERRLLGRYDPARGLQLDCRDCGGMGRACMVWVGWGERDWLSAPKALFGGVRGIKPALNRVRGAVHAFYRDGIADRTVACFYCGALAPLRLSPETFDGANRDVQTTCPRCARPRGLSCTSGVASVTPEFRAFQEAHGRVRSLPAVEVEAEGTTCLVVRWRSIHSADRLDLVYARDPLILMRVH